MAGTMSTRVCAVCHEPIRQGEREVDWVHIHSGDRQCWTGDGSTAYPAEPTSSEEERMSKQITMADAINTDDNPHAPDPIEPLCCSFHFPVHNTPVAPHAARLECLRAAIHAQNISYGELAELQSLAEHIDPSDVELLEWAGVPEFPEDEVPDEHTDRYGRTWPDVPVNERCPTCGQPDNCGDCQHGRLTDDEVRLLGGVVAGPSSCDRCGTELFIDISKREGRCDDCRKDDQDKEQA